MFRKVSLVAAAAGVVLGTASQAQHTFQNNVFFENAVNGNVNAALPIFDGDRLIGSFCNDELAPGDPAELLTNPYAPATPFALTNTGWQPKESSVAVGGRGCGVAAVDELALRVDLDPTCQCTDVACPDFLQSVCYRGAVPPASSGEGEWYAGWINRTYGSSDVAALPVRTVGPGMATENSGDGSPWVWEAGFVYLIQGRCAVPAGQTLTIRPGVLARSGSNLPPDYLVVERGGKLNAQGTAAAPIVLTSDQPNGSMDRGDWGGLVIHGRACANCADCVHGVSCTSEGGAGDFCGADDLDNSGTVRYLRVEYAGFEVSVNNELNCFTMNAVGCGTTLEYIQTHMGSDDGFEWFGGRAHCRYLVATGISDDSFDWQMGYRGQVQFGIAQAFDDQGDAGFEADNNEFNFNAPCRSNPIFANMTLIGRGPTAIVGGGRGAHLRRGTDAQIVNSIWTGWNRADRAAIFVENAETQARGVFAPVALSDCDDPAEIGDLADIGAVIRTYPNPVSEYVQFEFELPLAGRARMMVFDSNGRVIDTVLDGELTAGSHQIGWAVPADLAAGSYYYHLQGGNLDTRGRFVAVR